MKKKQKGKRLRKSKIQDQDLEPKAIQEMKNKKEDKKDKNDKTKKNKKIKKAKLLLIIVSIIIIILGIKLAISTHVWKSIAKDMTLNENSIVKDINGNTIATLGSEIKKKVVSYNEIPDNLKNAYVAIEDERFYSHGGVDIKRTASAIGSYIIHFGSSSFFIYPNSFIFVKTVFVLFIILLELSLSEKGLYEFGELFIPAKNAHSSSVKFCTDLLK